MLILMHMRGTPETMQSLLDYDNLIGEISEFLAKAAARAQSKGVAKDRIIIDPGIGFAKSVDDNFRIIKHIPELIKLGYPVLIGASRKSFIGKTLDLPADDRLEGSLAAAVSAMIHGAAILRVHDVLSTVRAIAIAARIEEAE
jgi:dihydropteroate synthase